jgi:hypothetical protein
MSSDGWTDKYDENEVRERMTLIVAEHGDDTPAPEHDPGDPCIECEARRRLIAEHVALDDPPARKAQS